MAFFGLRLKHPSGVLKGAWTRRAALGGLASVAAARVLSPMPARADTWPNRPVTIIVPFPPGGNTDTMARLLAAKLSEKFGQAFIVDNRAGASGAIGTTAVAHAAPDGYTLLFCAVQQVSVIPFTEHVTYNPKTDLSFISIFGEGPFVLGVAGDTPANSMKEFIDFAKTRKPGELVYASGGIGSISHLVAALYFQRAGVKLIHVPYRGGAPAVADLLGAHVNAYFGNASELVPFATDPRVKLIGVSSRERLAQLPSIPAVNETIPGLVMTSWNGLVGPAKLPRDIIEKLAAATAETARDPAIVKTLTSLGIAPIGNTPREFEERIVGETALLAEAIKAAELPAP